MLLTFRPSEPFHSVPGAGYPLLSCAQSRRAAFIRTCHSQRQTVPRAAKSDGPGWNWEQNAKKVDEETPPAWIHLLYRHVTAQRPLFLRDWLSESDPGLNQSLISSGTTISQLFDQDKWENHRSVNRYIRDLYGITKSTVLRRIIKPCSIVCLAGVLVCLWNSYAAPSLSAKMGYAGASLLLSSSVIPHTLLGAAISLLLVFRTNSCHARFSEGRLLWGRAVAASRRWSLLTRWHLPDAYHSKAASYVKVWAVVLKSHLRSGRTRADPNDPTRYRDDPSAFVQQHFDGQQAQLLLSKKNRPLLILAFMSSLLADASGHLNVATHASIQNCIDEFGAINGGCERLLSTPLPLSYTRHCSRTLFMWLLSLPVVLWSSMGPAMIPAVFFVSYVLLGIDELASEIEEPFSILPLTPLTNIIVQETQELFQMG